MTWRSERQSSVSRSTAEAEYIAASEGVSELVWFNRFMKELIGPYTAKLFIDNVSAIKLVKNPVQHRKTKHIDVRFHFIREKYFPKPMPYQRLQYLRDALNIKEF